MASHRLLRRPAAQHLLLALLLLAGWLLAGGLLAGPALAQTMPQPQQTAAPITTDEMERTVKMLEDPAQREVMVRQLRAMIAAQKAEKRERPVETLGTRMLTTLSERVEKVGNQLATTGEALVDTPRAMAWVNRQINDPARRETWLRLLMELTIVVVAGVSARFTMRWLLRGPRAALGERPAPTVWAKVPLLLGRGLLDLLPVVAFAAAGYGVLTLVETQKAVRLAALTFLNASIFVQTVMLTTRLLLSPLTPNLRLLKVTDETALYLTIWTRRIAFTSVYGYFVAQAAQMLGLPAQPYEAMLKLVGLVVAVMLLVITLQKRHAVGDWLRHDRAAPVPPGPDPADTALAAAVAGEAAPAAPAGPARPSVGSGAAGRALAAARHRLADVWHILASVYIVVIFGIWALEIQGGFEFVLRATLISGAALMLATLLTRGLDQLVHHAFTLAPQMKAQYPLLEARAHRYLPILHRLLRTGILVTATLAVLQAWGVDGLAWLQSPPGQRIVSAAVSIGVTLLIAIGAWELVSSGIERYLTAKDRTTGKALERSARVRTLLPLLRNAFLILLLTMVALTVLSELGMDIAPLLAGAGVIGLAIGFGSQTLVKDVITGMFILFEDTIAVGDVVDVGNGHSGLVEAISIRTIRLRDMSGTVHAVPFSSVTSLKNLTKDFSFYMFDVNVAYQEDTDRVVKVLEDLGMEMMRDPRYAPLILAPLEIIGVDGFQENAVLIKARFKTRPIQQWTVGREFNRRMKRRFGELGIEIPFPQRTVHIVGMPPEGLARPTLAAAGAAD